MLRPWTSKCSFFQLATRLHGGPVDGIPAERLRRDLGLAGDGEREQTAINRNDFRRLLKTEYTPSAKVQSRIISTLHQQLEIAEAYAAPSGQENQTAIRTPLSRSSRRK